MTLILQSPRRHAQAGLAAQAVAIAALLARIAWRPVRAWLDRRALAGLMAFDDRMLADIGVTRSDVASALVADEELASEALARRADERRRGDRARARALLARR